MSQFNLFMFKVNISSKSLIIYLGVMILFLFFGLYNIKIDFDISSFEILFLNRITIYFDSMIRFALLLNAIVLSLVSLKDATSEMVNLNIILFNQIGINKIFFAKVTNLFKITLMQTIIEYLIIVFFPIIFWPSFKIELIFFLILPYLFLFSFWISLLSFFLINTTKAFYVIAIPLVLVVAIFFIELPIKTYFVMEVNYYLTLTDILPTYLVYVLLNLTIFNLAYLNKMRLVKN